MGSEKSYFVKRDATVSGPFSLPQLKNAIAGKKLRGSDKLAATREGPWTGLNDVYKQILAGRPPELDQSMEQEIGLVELEDIGAEDDWDTLDTLEASANGLGEVGLSTSQVGLENAPLSSTANTFSGNVLQQKKTVQGRSDSDEKPSFFKSKLFLGCAAGGAALLMLSIAGCSGALFWLWSGSNFGGSEFNPADLTSTMRWMKSNEDFAKLESYSGQVVQWELSPLDVWGEYADLYRFENIGSRSEPVLLCVQANLGPNEGGGDFIEGFASLSDAKPTDTYLITGAIASVEVWNSKSAYSFPPSRDTDFSEDLLGRSPAQILQSNQMLDNLYTKGREVEWLKLLEHATTRTAFGRPTGIDADFEGKLIVIDLSVSKVEKDGIPTEVGSSSDLSPQDASEHRTESSNNLRTIAIAIANFKDVHQKYPAIGNKSQSGEELISWRVHILPYLGEEELYEQFKLEEPWNSEHNKKLVEKMPDIYRSPRGSNKPGFTNYLGNAFGSGIVSQSPSEGILGQATSANRGPRSEISDAAPSTLLVVEVNESSGVEWTKPSDCENDSIGQFIQRVKRPNEIGFLAVTAAGTVETVFLRGEDQQKVRSRLTRTPDD